MTAVSVVIPAHNEGRNLVDTVRCTLDNHPGSELEVVVVDDGSTDGSPQRVERRFGTTGRVSVVRGSGLGVAGARNLGAERARGEVLIFLDGHCWVPPGALSRMAALVADPEVGLVGPAFASLGNGEGAAGFGAVWRNPQLEMDWLPRQSDRPYPVPLLPGGCHAIRASALRRLGGYDDRMTRWGSEDHELSLRVWLMGLRVLVEPRAVIHHLFRSSHPYRVEYPKILYNRLRLALVHFSHQRLARVMASLSHAPGFAESLVLLLESDAMERRRRLAARRRRADDWFFHQFQCGV